MVMLIFEHGPFSWL